ARGDRRHARRARRAADALEGRPGALRPPAARRRECRADRAARRRGGLRRAAEPARPGLHRHGAQVRAAADARSPPRRRRARTRRAEPPPPRRPVSLAVGLAAMAVTVLIGAVVGAVAGYRGGLVDTLLLRLTDAMLSFPPIFMLLALAAFVRPSLASMTVFIGVTSWMDVTRMVRSQILTLPQREFVLGARPLGAPASGILPRYLLPH